MKVLTVSNCPLVETQGSGYVITNFCRGMRERGHQVDAFGPENYEPWSFLKGKAKGHRLTLGMATLTKRQLAKQKYDIVEFYGANAWLAISKLRKTQSCSPLIVSHSNGLETQYSEMMHHYLGDVSSIDGRRRKWYQKIGSNQTEKAFTLADRLVTVSDCNAEYARRKHYLPDTSILAVNNSLPDDFFNLPVTFDRPSVIGYCGSWMTNKGSHTIVKDIGRLLGEYPQCKFRLIGVGAGFQLQEHFADDVRDRIEVVPFTTNKTELRRHYSNLSILITPSIYEGFGLVSAEAMACGCALVASKTGYAASLLHGKEALLMPEPCSPHLYEALKELLDNDICRKQIAQNGYRKVQSLRWETATDKLEQAYEQWLQEFRQNKI